MDQRCQKNIVALKSNSNTKNSTSSCMHPCEIAIYKSEYSISNNEMGFEVSDLHQFYTSQREINNYHYQIDPKVKNYIKKILSVYALKFGISQSKVLYGMSSDFYETQNFNFNDDAAAAQKSSGLNSGFGIRNLLSQHGEQCTSTAPGPLNKSKKTSDL